MPTSNRARSERSLTASRPGGGASAARSRPRARCARAAARGVELAPQIADVGLEHAGVAAEVIAPDVVEQLRPRHHAPSVEHQVAQQPVLGHGQLDRHTAAGDLAQILVELQIGEPQRLRPRRDRARAAQDHPQPCHQFLQAERLGHVVLATDRQPADLVGRVVPRRQEQDRHLGALRRQPPGDVEPLHVGQHHVEHDRVRTPVSGLAQRVGAGAGGGHLVPMVAQTHAEDVDDARLVVDDEHAQRLRRLGDGGRADAHGPIQREKRERFVRTPGVTVLADRGNRNRVTSTISPTPVQDAAAPDPGSGRPPRNQAAVRALAA